MREVLLPDVPIGLEPSGRTGSDVEIGDSGYLVLGDDEGEIARKMDAMRTPLSLHGSMRSGSTRWDHAVLRLHEPEELGQALHALWLRGRWDAMREAVTLDHLRALAETCTDDELPGLLARRRRSATRIGLSTPIKTPEQRERFHDALARVRAPPTPGGRSGSISSALVPARRSGGAAPSRGHATPRIRDVLDARPRRSAVRWRFGLDRPGSFDLKVTIVQTGLAVH
jgi:hypothetical protein